MRTALDGLLEAVPGMTALIVHNEPAIPLLLEELAARGLRVPEDLSILAVAPDTVAEHARPALTSVCIPVEEIGRSAVQLAMRQLDGEPVEHETLLPPRVIVRSSTAPPPGADGDGDSDAGAGAGPVRRRTGSAGRPPSAP